MARKKAVHKQSKYFTIMLIPDSSIKVFNVKIPHWILYSFGIGIIVLCCFAAFFGMKSAYLKHQSYLYSNKLNLTLQEKEELSASLREEIEELNSSLSKEIQNKESQGDYFEGRLEELMEKLDKIDSIKEDIYNKIGDLEEKGAPTSLSKLDINEAASFMGGPHIPVSEVETLEQLFDVLDSKLTNDLEQLVIFNEIADNVEPFTKAYPSGTPVNGSITSEFSVRSNPFGGSGSEFHSGIDFKASIGTKIHATGGGTVSFAGVQNGYGYLVIIDHGYGYSTYYAHNSELLVNVGDKVSRGDCIALSGNTGRSTGPHCHYEVRINGTAQNPRKYF